MYVAVDSLYADWFVRNLNPLLNKSNPKEPAEVASALARFGESSNNVALYGLLEVS